MQPKDVVDILISASTFILAVVVAIMTARSGKSDELRTLRNQLTDTFNQYFATNLQLGQQQPSYGNGNYAQSQEVSSLLGQQSISLLSQAMFLANKIEKLVTAVEYNTLAAGNAFLGEFPLANKYAQKAIETCDKADMNLRARATYSYGMILFMESNFKDGNTKFQEALDLLKNAGLEKNFAHYLTGSIYVKWATSEKQWSAPESTPDDHYKAAEAEFNAIEIPLARERALHELNEAKNAADSAPLQTLGNPQAMQTQQSIFTQIHTPGWFQKTS